MRFLKSMGVVVAIAVLSFVFVPKASADKMDQRTIVTFDQPIEVPGALLAPDTYVFKVVGGTRGVIQVLNKAENHQYATFVSVPESRNKPFDKTVIRLAKRPTPTGSPMAITTLFLPGRTDGHGFVYPRQSKSSLAAKNQ